MTLSPDYVTASNGLPNILNHHSHHRQNAHRDKSLWPNCSGGSNNISSSAEIIWHCQPQQNATTKLLAKRETVWCRQQVHSRILNNHNSNSVLKQQKQQRYRNGDASSLSSATTSRDPNVECGSISTRFSQLRTSTATTMTTKNLDKHTKNYRNQELKNSRHSSIAR